MKVWVYGNAAGKEAIGLPTQTGDIEFIYPEAINPVPVRTGDAVIDLLFDHSAERIALLQNLGASLVVINCVVGTLEALPDHFARINGWPGFLERSSIEAACKNDSIKEKVGLIFAAMGKKTEWVADIDGFITARIVVAIINEAFHTFEEKVSTREDIDIAMKLGTNYPYGPFEWADKIGLKNIYALLVSLSREKSRYEPAALLKEEAN